MGKLWGPNPYLTRWAYLCVVRPALVFGHIVWGHKINTRALKLKLDKLQAEALRLCGHFRRSTPRMGMEIVLNVPPLDLFSSASAGYAGRCQKERTTSYSDAQVSLISGQTASDRGYWTPGRNGRWIG